MTHVPSKFSVIMPGKGGHPTAQTSREDPDGRAQPAAPARGSRESQAGTPDPAGAASGSRRPCGHQPPAEGA